MAVTPSIVIFSRRLQTLALWMGPVRGMVDMEKEEGMIVRGEGNPIVEDTQWVILDDGWEWDGYVTEA